MAVVLFEQWAARPAAGAGGTSGAGPDLVRSLGGGLSSLLSQSDLSSSI